MVWRVQREWPLPPEQPIWSRRAKSPDSSAHADEWTVCAASPLQISLGTAGGHLLFTVPSTAGTLACGVGRGPGLVVSFGG